MHVAKWGNSLAVRLPKSVVEALGLKEGDDIEIISPDDVRSRSSGLRRPRNFCGGCVNSAVGFRPDSVSIGSKRMSASEIFFDTNVLLYLISGDPVKAEQAEH